LVCSLDWDNLKEDLPDDAQQICEIGYHVNDKIEKIESEVQNVYSRLSGLPNDGSHKLLNFHRLLEIGEVKILLERFKNTISDIIRIYSVQVKDGEITLPHLSIITKTGAIEKFGDKEQFDATADVVWEEKMGSYIEEFSKEITKFFTTIEANERDKYMNIDIAIKPLAFYLSAIKGFINSFYPLIKNAKDQWLSHIKLDVSEEAKREKNRVITYIKTYTNIVCDISSSIINYTRGEGYIKNEEFIKNCLIFDSRVLANLLMQFEIEGRSKICKSIAKNDKYQSIITVLSIHGKYQKEKDYLKKVVTPFHMVTSKKLPMYNKLIKMRATDLNLILTFIKERIIVSKFNNLKYIPFKEHVQSMSKLAKTNCIVRPTNEDLRLFWGFFIINIFSIVGFSISEEQKKKDKLVVDAVF